MQQVLNVIIALVIFMVMITIHELGHFTAGKLLKFKINEFAVGMGPKVLSKKSKSGTVFSLRALPLGGFCAFDGEDADQDNAEAFNNQKPWKRIIVLLAGVTFNFLTAMLIGVIMFSCYGDTVVTVRDVYGYAPESNQVLMQDDIIYKVDGKEVYIAGDLASYFPKDETFDIVVIRDGQEVLLTDLMLDTFYIPKVDEISGEYYGVNSNGNKHKLIGGVNGDTIYSIDGQQLGDKGIAITLLTTAKQNGATVDMVITTITGQQVTFDDVDAGKLLDDIAIVESTYTGIGMSIGYDKMQYTFGQSLTRIVPYCFEIAGLVLRTIGGMFTGLVGIDAVGGPITTIAITSEVVASGFANVLSLVVMLSVNLAIFNILPIPALDGCRILFVIIEWIKGSPVNRKVEGIIHAIGLILLLAFVIFLEVARYL